MPIETVPPLPQGSVPTQGTGTVERVPAMPEPSFVAPVMPQPRETDKTPPGQASKEAETEVDRAIEAVEVMMVLRERSVKFEKDDSTGTNVIKIVDDKTGEVIRQMPAEELLNFMRNLTKMLGNFLDERV